MREYDYIDALCNTADGVFVTDADKHIIRWNKGAERILGHTEADVLNRDCFHVLSGRSLPEGNVCCDNCNIHVKGIMGTPLENFDIQTQASDGKQLWLNITLISSSGIGTPCLTHIMRDVTREKKVSIALNQFLFDLNNNNHSSNHDTRTGRYSTDATTPSGNPTASLSAREIEVLTLLAEGLSTKGLAQRLNISHFTARNHIQNILVKLDLHSKAQAVSYAFKKGLL
jgi:PAS domain S-box-containing protein